MLSKMSLLQVYKMEKLSLSPHKPFMDIHCHLMFHFQLNIQLSNISLIESESAADKLGL